MKIPKGLNPMFKKTDAHNSKLFAGVTGIAALALLTACAAEGPSEEPPADQQTEQSVQPDDAQSTPADEATDQTEDAGDDTTAEGNATASGEDPVYTIVEAVENEYDGGFIVEIDRDDDNDSQYEVDVVVDNELLALEVTTDGSISEDEREGDDDDIANAEQATVPVNQALDQAFEEHPDATFDQIDLDEDDGVLEWDIDLDDANGSEIELTIPATS